MDSTERTIFAQLEFARRILLVFCRRVITTLAGTACKGNNISHINNLNTEKITLPLPGAG
jgi:hypothetical protein